MEPNAVFGVRSAPIVPEFVPKLFAALPVIAHANG
jgi:hypothetical protein